MDAGEIAQCAQMRDEEWDVLYVTSIALPFHNSNFLLIHSPQSIYPECLTSSQRPDPSSPQEATIKLDIPVEMGEYDIQIYRAVSSNPMANGEPTIPPANEDGLAEVPDEHAMDRFANLPPLLLTLVLPIEYPMRRPPILKTVHATSDWLPGPVIASTAKRLQEIWDGDAEGSGVLWRTCDWIRSGEFLTDTGLLQGGVIRCAPLSFSVGPAQLPHQKSLRIPHPAPALLLRRLAAHNSSALDKTFASTTFTCAICFSERKGTKCIRLSACSHVFCRECLTDFWSLHIREGDVDKVTCADPECVKEESKQQGTIGGVREEDVRRVVSDKEVTRWQALKRKRELERDPTLVYCPIAVCQAPVPATDAQKVSLAGAGVGAGAGAATPPPYSYSALRTCASCSFSFCDLCRRSWHGLAPCSATTTAALLQEYLAHPDGSPERAAMARRFGTRINLQRMARVWQEEEDNRKWIQGNSVQCPNCAVATEKSMGCNHVSSLLFWAVPVIIRTA
jgi:E3 ubiquitin-protein ligase RNF14